METLPRGAGPLRYTLAIPRGAAGRGTRPLVVALHYSVGQEITPPYYGRDVLEKLFVPALADLDAILVAPDSIAGDWASPASEDAVLRVTDHIAATHPVDPGRVLLTGYSMGGAAAWRIAAHHPERFCAAIPISGRAGPGARVPIHVIHSADDELIPLAPLRRHVEQLQCAGYPICLTEAAGITHYETARFAPVLGAALPWVRALWG